MNDSLPKKMRLDILIFNSGLTESREKAQALILQGSVSVNGKMIDKAGASVQSTDKIKIKDKIPYVSRGGLKIEHAIDEFDIDLTGKTVMDIGASTGGFTDCMLQKGASKVYAVDVGYGQFSWALRNDSRVVLFEKTNIRNMSTDLINDKINLAAIDVSFISLLKVLPNILKFLEPDSEVIALIKPQFEADRKDIAKGGVVRDDNVRLNIVDKIKRESALLGLDIIGVAISPIKGPKGNIEYLMYAKTP
ncbi:MAG: TlyA family RNA methyltransferase [Nitrospira sp.]|nr:TlyA family RNA methyltransferase [bacterium]MBL7048823.1 TlyA family RNA methyltransferase [Nitrospira sp.]